jgi:GT2 family glycosyltransferase
MRKNKVREDAVAVVIPAWRNWSTIDRVLEALIPQLRPDDQVVVVESSGDGRAIELRSRWPRVEVIASPGRLATIPARLQGIAATSAPLIVFLDADSVPEQGWLKALLGALGDADAVGGSVRNGTPRSVVGTASYLIEFLRWHPEAPKQPDSLVACTLLVRRTTFEAVGGFRGEIWPGEDTLLTYPLMRAERARFCPGAVITHHNRTSLRWLIRHDFGMGRSFAEVCRHGGFRPAWLGRRPLAPVTGTLRWLVTMPRVASHLHEVRRKVAVLTVISIGLAAWTAGIAVGPRQRPKS